MKKQYIQFFFGPSYSSEATAVFARMPDAMPTALKNAWATFIDSQVASGNWSKIIDIVRLDANTRANSKRSWKGVFPDAVFGGAGADWSIYSDVVTWGTGYIDTGFIPNNVAAFGLNDCGFGVGLRADNVGTGSQVVLFGVIEADTTKQFICNRTTTPSIQYRANTSSASTTTGIVDFSDHKFYAVDKQATTTIRLLEESTTIDTNTIVNGAKATSSIYIGARNNSGTADLHLAGHYRHYVAYQAVGFDVANFVTNLNILNAAIDALIPYLLVIYQVGAQSNEDGRAELNRAAALSSYDTTDLPSTRLWYKSTWNTTDNGAFRQLILGTNNVNEGIEPTVNQFGCELSLSRLIWQNHKIPITWVRTARGGVSLSTAAGEDWNPANTGEAYDKSTDAYFHPTRVKLGQLFPGKTIKVLLSSQVGETDSDPANFGTSLSNFATAIRAEHSLLASCPWFLNKLYYNLDANETLVNNATAAYVAGASNAYYFDVASQVTYPRKQDLPAGIRATYPPAGSGVDDQHNSYEFQIKKGELYYAKLIELGYL